MACCAPIRPCVTADHLQVPTCGAPHVRNHALPILRNTVLAEARKSAPPHLSKSQARRPWARDQVGLKRVTRRRQQHVTQRMPLEQISEFQILAQHIERLVPAGGLELGGVGALGHAGGERTALQAVAAKF